MKLASPKSALVFVTMLLSPLLHAAAGPFDGKEFKGRLAHSADGNANDEDDWAAFPVAMALIDAFGQMGKLVHVDYNNILQKDDARFYKNMTDSVHGAAERYRIPSSVMFDCKKDLNGAIDSIARAINASSADNPLYFVLAGPMEVPLLGIQKSDPAKRKYVYCISHSVWNDGFPQPEKVYLHKYTKRDVIETGVNWVQVKAGSGLTNSTRTSSTPEQWALYHWMRDSKDKRLGWIYSRLEVEERCDVSDATMTYFLFTGDQDATPAKLKAVLEDKKLPDPVKMRSEVRIEAENFQTLKNYESIRLNDKTASHLVSVKQSKPGTGSISTTLNQPYAPDSGQFDVEIRYFDASTGRSELKLFVAGVQQGETWFASANSDSWQSKTIAGMTINAGDEIQVSVRGEGGDDGKLDYVQLNTAKASHAR